MLHIELDFPHTWNLQDARDGPPCRIYLTDHLWFVEIIDFLPKCRFVTHWGHLMHMHIYLVDHHDDVIKWKHFPRYWPFVRRIHRSPVNSAHKGQWRGALMFSLICARINGWVNTSVACDLRRHQAHCDVIIMIIGHLLGAYLVQSFPAPILCELTSMKFK